MGLLQRADANQIDLHEANIIEISNAGFSVFGMVNVEFARESGRLNPSYPSSGPRNLPGERNWYHHIVLEVNGFIYDYDFGNTPQIAGVREYFERMFLREKMSDEGGEFFVGREDKLKNYKIVVRSALETLQAQRNRWPGPEGRKYSLGDFLHLFPH